MLKQKSTLIAIFCAVALTASPVLLSARPNSDTTKTEKKSIQINDQATVDGKTLSPGKYEVLIEGNKVSFERNGRTVVTAPCSWKTLPTKSQYDSTTFSTSRALQEIQFEGKDQALEVM